MSLRRAGRRLSPRHGPRDVEHDSHYHDGDRKIAERVTVRIAPRTIPQFVPDNRDHRDWQPGPPVRDQPLTYTGLAANLDQAPGRREKQDQENNEDRWLILVPLSAGVKSLKRTPAASTPDNNHRGMMEELRVKTDLTQLSPTCTRPT